MSDVAKRLIRYLKREDGPTAVEYAVLLALIVVVCLTAIGPLGSQASTTFRTTGAKLKLAASSVARDQGGVRRCPSRHFSTVRSLSECPYDANPISHCPPNGSAERHEHDRVRPRLLGGSGICPRHHAVIPGLTAQPVLHFPL